MAHFPRTPKARIVCLYPVYDGRDAIVGCGTQIVRYYETPDLAAKLAERLDAQSYEDCGGEVSYNAQQLIDGVWRNYHRPQVAEYDALTEDDFIPF